VFLAFLFSAGASNRKNCCFSFDRQTAYIKRFLSKTLFAASNSTIINNPTIAFVVMRTLFRTLHFCLTRSSMATHFQVTGAFVSNLEPTCRNMSIHELPKESPPGASFLCETEITLRNSYQQSIAVLRNPWLQFKTVINRCNEVSLISRRIKHTSGTKPKAFIKQFRQGWSFLLPLLDNGLRLYTSSLQEL